MPPSRRAKLASCYAYSCSSHYSLCTRPALSVLLSPPEVRKTKDSWPLVLPHSLFVGPYKLIFLNLQYSSVQPLCLGKASNTQTSDFHTGCFLCWLLSLKNLYKWGDFHSIFSLHLNTASLDMTLPRTLLHTPHYFISVFNPPFSTCRSLSFICLFIFSLTSQDAKFCADVGCAYPSLNNQQVAEPSPQISKLTLSLDFKLLKYLTREFWKTVCRWVPWVAEVLIKSITSDNTEG